MKKKAMQKSNRRYNESGFTIFEYLIALIIIGVGLVAWLNLSVTGVKNGTFVTKLNSVKWASSTKAVELIKTEDLSALIPKGQKSIGTIAPYRPSRGFSDELNEKGWLIAFDPKSGQQYLIDPLGNTYFKVQPNDLIPKFTRQWMIVKNHPSKDEITVFVSVTYNDTNQIVRVSKEVKIDGLSLTSSPTP